MNAARPPRKQPEQDRAAAERRGKRWIAIIVGFLVADAVGVLLLVWISSRPDPSHYVEPNHYRKALDFNETLAQRRANEQLGWQLDVELAAAGGDVEVLLRALDRQRRPLRGARVEMVAFHQSRAAVRTRVRMVRRGQRYVAPLKRPRAGVWELQFVIERRQQRFTKTISRWVAPKAASRRSRGSG